MNINSTKKLHLTKPNHNCKPGDCSVEDRKACRAEIRDMVVESDNILMQSTLLEIGSFVTGLMTAGTALATFTGNANVALGIAGSVVGGAATVGLQSLYRSKEEQAEEKFYAAFDRAEQTGCYEHDELYRWYREHVTI